MISRITLVYYCKCCNLIAYTLGIKRREIGQVRHSFDSAVVCNSVGKFNMAHLMSGKKNV